ncbi:transporter [Aspergillus sclerotialis]|uniref:Transporter n=1 Tax=Aspergillus sclerotialis TaxID=2070753 RepID=A0A3A2ZSZ6_9EURO|nr:transporter [Aspergillus sclerotialis]
MTAVWLLPIVTCVVASSSGAVVADVLSNAQHALWTILASYILWGIGVPFAMMVMVIYLHRLTLHKLPAKSVIVSAFLPLGPLGQGSFGIMKLGSVAQKVLPKTHSLQSSSPDIFYTAGFLIGIILWSFGLVWFFFAVASIFKTRTFPFNIGWWGFTFPIGVFATGTCQMGQELPSTFFNVLGTIISLCVVILWMVVSIGTIRGIITGTVFYDQVVAEYDGKEEDKRQISMTKGVYSA